MNLESSPTENRKNKILCNILYNMNKKRGIRKERTKYYTISLKDRELRTKFNKIGKRKEGFSNADDKMRYLLSLADLRKECKSLTK
jgi:hypothetical protein